MNAVAADGEIVALDQQKSEIARQCRVFEIGFTECAGRQQSDTRLVAIGASAQTVAERLEEGSNPLHIHRFVERGKSPRQDQPVFQRVAGSRRRLAAVAQYPPAPVGPAADIGGIEIEKSAAWRSDSVNRAQKFGAAGDGRRGYRAL